MQLVSQPPALLGAPGVQPPLVLGLGAGLRLRVDEPLLSHRTAMQPPQAPAPSCLSLFICKMDKSALRVSSLVMVLKPGTFWANHQEQEG